MRCAWRKTLRVALLSTLEPVPGGTSPRALLRVGGLSVLRQQVRLALTLGCERVVCLGAGLTGELVEIQHLVERAGSHFHLISGPRALGGLVTANDEVIAIDDGLLAPLADLSALLGQGQGVLVQPIEQGLEAGFERIDINHASAGAMRVPGRLVERLAELPGDCDTISALQRIALQSGVPQRSIPPAGQRSPVWALVRQESDAQVLEPLWIRMRTRQDQPLGPSRWLALVGVRRFGPALLHAGSGATVTAIGAALLGLLGLGAGWFRLVALGLVFCALGWIARQAAAMLAQIDDAAEGLVQGLRSEVTYGWFLDAILIALTGWVSAASGGPGGLARYFPALMLFALMRILPRTLGPHWAAWLDDRALVAVLLAVATLAGYPGPAVLGGGLALAAAGILLPNGELQLTQP